MVGSTDAALPFYISAFSEVAFVQRPALHLAWSCFEGGEGWMVSDTLSTMICVGDTNKTPWWETRMGVVER